MDKVIEIDQSPIGRTPRSNPATYTNLFGPIRDLFASLPESKIRGYKPGRFSFNVKGGRCEACQGQGQNRIEMQFLPDIYVPCEICDGSRYNKETLQVTLKGLNIAEVRDLTWDTLGVERDRSGLERAIRELERQRTALGLHRGRVNSRGEGELRNLIEVALLVAHAARLREESRGSHYRSDFPRQRDSFCRRLPLRLVSDRELVTSPEMAAEIVCGSRPAVTMGERLVVEAPLLADPAPVAEIRSL